MSYLGIGTKYPNHNLEIDGNFFISNVEMGSTNQGVPFEIYSDYTNKNFLTNSRQFRTRVTPFNRPDYTYHTNMGIENQSGNVFFISNPVSNETIIGDKVFKIDDQKNTLLESNILYSQAITCSNIFNNPLDHSTTVGDFNVIGLDKKIKQVKIKKCIAARYSVHCLGIDGEVYSGGYNDYGQLGIGRISSFENTFSTALGPASSNVIDLSVSPNHSIVVKDDGGVYAVGDNSYNQLGIKNYNNIFSTVYIRTALEFELGSIQSIVASHYSTMILTKDNKVYGVGRNDYGQLGLGFTSSSVTSFTGAIGAGSSDVKKIAMGVNSGYIIKNDGSVWGTGKNDFGQLGIGTTSPYVTSFTAAIGAGSSEVSDISAPNTSDFGGNAIILKNDGSVWGTGYNINGALGLGFTSSSVTSFTAAIGAGSSDVIKINTSYTNTIILKNDGSVWETGYRVWAVPSLTSTFTAAIGAGTSGVTDVSTALYEAAIIKDNLPYFVGSNYQYYLGGRENLIRQFSKQYIDESINILAIDNATLTYKSGNFLKVEDKSNKILKKIKEISSGTSHVMVLTEDNMLYGMGLNNYGQLGLKRRVDNAPELTYIRNNVSNVSCGNSYTMIIDSNGTLSGTGRNSNGQLGIESTISKFSFTSNETPVITSMVSCGESHTLIIGTNNSLSATGRNNYGQLGNGTTTDINVFTEITTPVEVKTISCGNDFSMIIGTNNSLSATGHNNYGQLGNGTTTDINVFTEITTPVEVKTISCGSTHSMMIGADDRIYGTGRNSYGQLGIGNTTDKQSFTQADTIIYADAISTGDDTTVVISNEKVYGTGDNFLGQLGLGVTNSVSTFTYLPNVFDSVEHLSCGDNFTILGNNKGELELTGFTTNFRINTKQFTQLVQTEFSNVFDLQTQFGGSIFFKIIQGNNIGAIGENNSGLMNIGVEVANQISNTYVTINNTGTFTATSFLSFTGAHNGRIDMIPEEGMIVSVNNSCVSTINNVISDVNLSKSHKDPNVFGISRGDGLFNAIGEGAIWVCDANGPLTSGDYIVSSTLTGYGIRQDGTRKANYTVAKILQDCIFEDDNTRYLSMSEENSLSTISREQYLTDTGNVYKASFVGCTYHCG